MRAIYYRALPGDFETHPVGTVKDLEAEIERLRLEFYHYENENTYKGNSIRHWYGKAMAYGKSLDEANGEIERLQKQHDNFLQEFWKTNAENERLRAALERIESNVGFSKTFLQKIAGEALLRDALEEAFDRAPVGAQTDHGPKLGETSD